MAYPDPKEEKTVSILTIHKSQIVLQSFWKQLEILCFLSLPLVNVYQAIYTCYVEEGP